MSAIDRHHRNSAINAEKHTRRRMLRFLRSGKTINTYLPMEIMREIFLYCIESNEMKSGQLASVCRYWRSGITTMSHLWSTLRVGTWTETAQVVTWLQRAYPKGVIIDPQGDTQSPSEAPMFAALQSSLTSTGQWNELTISSFPPENLASQLGVQVASPMNLLKVLHVEAGCVHSPSFAHLLNLVPTEAPLCEMRLHSPFASTHFLQPHGFLFCGILQCLLSMAEILMSHLSFFLLLPSFRYLRLIVFISHFMSPIPICLFSVLFGSCSLEPVQSNGWLGDNYHALRSVQSSFLVIGR